MVLTDVTSYDEVRAVLGVSTDELEDATLQLPLYWQQLMFELEDVDIDLPDLYNTIKASTSRTSKEQRLFNIVQVFSAYAISKTLLVSATLFAPKKIDDGKAGLERFSDPFQQLRDDIDKAYIAVRQRLLNALTDIGVVIPVVTSRVYLGVAPLAINPITNE